MDEKQKEEGINRSGFLRAAALTGSAAFLGAGSVAVPVCCPNKKILPNIDGIRSFPDMPS